MLKVWKFREAGQVEAIDQLMEAVESDIEFHEEGSFLDLETLVSKVSKRINDGRGWDIGGERFRLGSEDREAVEGLVLEQIGGRLG